MVLRPGSTPYRDDGRAYPKCIIMHDRLVPRSRSFAAMTAAAQCEMSGAAQAELVAFGIGQDEPVPGSLADVHLPRAKAEQPV
jgi:hypothetical protein